MLIFIPCSTPTATSEEKILLTDFLRAWNQTENFCIDSNFYLNSLCVKEKFADGLSEWNYDKFVEIYNNMPDDMILSTSISDSSRTDAFMKLVNIYSCQLQRFFLPF